MQHIWLMDPNSVSLVLWLRLSRNDIKWKLRILQNENIERNIFFTDSKFAKLKTINWKANANLASELLSFVTDFVVIHCSFPVRMRRYCCYCCYCCYYCCDLLTLMRCWPLTWPAIWMLSYHYSFELADVWLLFWWMCTVEIHLKSMNPSFEPCVGSWSHFEHCCKWNKIEIKNHFIAFIHN